MSIDNNPISELQGCQHDAIKAAIRRVQAAEARNSNRQRQSGQQVLEGPTYRSNGYDDEQDDE